MARKAQEDMFEHEIDPELGSSISIICDEAIRAEMLQVEEDYAEQLLDVGQEDEEVGGLPAWWYKVLCLEKAISSSSELLIAKETRQMEGRSKCSE
jgi:predicted solute-binding protein